MKNREKENVAARQPLDPLLGSEGACYEALLLLPQVRQLAG
jgi:hypothetical protein